MDEIEIEAEALREELYGVLISGLQAQFKLNRERAGIPESESA